MQQLHELPPLCGRTVHFSADLYQLRWICERLQVQNIRACLAEKERDWHRGCEDSVEARRTAKSARRVGHGRTYVVYTTDNDIEKSNRTKDTHNAYIRSKRWSQAELRNSRLDFEQATRTCKFALPIRFVT